MQSLRRNLQRFSLIRNLISIRRGVLFRSLLVQPLLHLRSQVSQVDEHTVLLGVAPPETQLLDTDLASCKFVLTKDSSEGNAILLSSFELRRELRFDLVREFGLQRRKLLANCYGTE